MKRMGLIGKRRDRQDWRKVKGLKRGQVVVCGRKRGKEWDERANREHQREKRRVKTMFDTSSQTHTQTLTHTRERERVLASELLLTVTLYISKERDLNMQGPRRSP